MHSVQDALGDGEHAVKINQSPGITGCSWVINDTYILGTGSVNLSLIAVSYNHNYYS